MVLRAKKPRERISSRVASIEATRLGTAYVTKKGRM